MAYIEDHIQPNDFITLPPSNNSFNNTIIKHTHRAMLITRERFIYAYIEKSITSVFIQIYELIALLSFVRNIYIDNRVPSARVILFDNLTEIYINIVNYDCNILDRNNLDTDDIDVFVNEIIDSLIVGYDNNIYIIELAFAGGDYDIYIEACNYINDLFNGIIEFR